MGPSALTETRDSRDSELPNVDALIDVGREHERAGRLSAAVTAYEDAIRIAAAHPPTSVLSEALRLLAIVRFRLQQDDEASVLCRRAYDVAVAVADKRCIAEALNTLACDELAHGDLDAAQPRYREALILAEGEPTLRARILQNLGIIANIRGDLATALSHYARSLEAYRDGGDRAGCIGAYHNLGMISADRGLLDDADEYFGRAMALATEINDQRYRALCLINHGEVFLARADYATATRHAVESLNILDAIGEGRAKADAYKLLGVAFRETGRTVMAEARLRQAIDLASSTGSVLIEAEAYRELALLARKGERNQEALNALNASHRLFKRMNARIDVVDVAGQLADLEGVFLRIVREWGESIESADAYTHGHCERVAVYALGVAQTLGLDAADQTTVRVGAYLHDLGKVKVPHEILSKPGRLTDTEFAIMKRHPVDGQEMLKAIEFPWNILPMIRSHHEKHDGSGYPDGLRGDDIPLHAQIICAADVFDALTTNRSYRGALAHNKAMAVMNESRQWWRPDVFEAFMAAPFHAKWGSTAAA